MQITYDPALVTKIDEGDEGPDASRRIDDGSFKQLIRYIKNQDAEEAAAYWRKQFEGLHDGKLCEGLAGALDVVSRIDTCLVFDAHAPGLYSNSVPG